MLVRWWCSGGDHGAGAEAVAGALAAWVAARNLLDWGWEAVDKFAQNVINYPSRDRNTLSCQGIAGFNLFVCDLGTVMHFHRVLIDPPDSDIGNPQSEM